MKKWPIIRTWLSCEIAISQRGHYIIIQCRYLIWKSMEREDPLGEFIRHKKKYSIWLNASIYPCLPDQCEIRFEHLDSRDLVHLEFVRNLAFTLFYWYGEAEVSRIFFFVLRAKPSRSGPPKSLIWPWLKYDRLRTRHPLLGGGIRGGRWPKAGSNDQNENPIRCFYIIAQ